MGSNPQDIKTVQSLFKEKDTQIKVLKKKIKIPDIDHVQTQEIQVMQQEKDQLAQQIIQLSNQLDIYKWRK